LGYATRKSAERGRSSERERRNKMNEKIVTIVGTIFTIVLFVVALKLIGAI
jgi:hypothetical protein